MHQRNEEEGPISRGALPYAWLYIVVGGPFLILGLTGGWSKAFETGAAAAYISGAALTAIGENLLERNQEHLASLKRICGDPKRLRAVLMDPEGRQRRSGLDPV